jgi:hypothetical protein
VVALFKQNTITTAAAALVLALLVKWPLLLQAPSAEAMEGFDRVFRYVVHPMQRAYTASAWAYSLVSIIVIMLWALYVNYVAIEAKLFSRSNYFPALLVVILSSFPLNAQIISVPFLAHTLVFVALGKTLALGTMAKPRRACFDIGFLLSTAVLCYPPALVFLPFFPLFLRTVRAVRWHEISAYVLGLFMPLYVYVALMFGMGKTSAVWQALPKAFVWPPQPMAWWPLASICAFYLFLWVYSLIRQNSPQWQPTAAANKKWSVIRWFLVPSLVGALFTAQTPGLAWMFFVSPFSLLCSLCFIHVKEKYNTFVFYFMIAAMLAMVWLF